MAASYAVSVRRASALPAASLRFHLTMDTLAVRLTVPPDGPVEDLNLQESAPCRAHQGKGTGEFLPLRFPFHADSLGSDGVKAKKAARACYPLFFVKSFGVPGRPVRAPAFVAVQACDLQGHVAGAPLLALCILVRQLCLGIHGDGKHVGAYIA